VSIEWIQGGAFTVRVRRCVREPVAAQLISGLPRATAAAATTNSTPTTGSPPRTHTHTHTPGGGVGWGVGGEGRGGGGRWVGVGGGALGSTCALAGIWHMSFGSAAAARCRRRPCWLVPPKASSKPARREVPSAGTPSPVAGRLAVEVRGAAGRLWGSGGCLCCVGWAWSTWLPGGPWPWPISHSHDPHSAAVPVVQYSEAGARGGGGGGGGPPPPRPPPPPPPPQLAAFFWRPVPGVIYLMNRSELSSRWYVLWIENKLHLSCLSSVSSCTRFSGFYGLGRYA
jgi:hypothetical protein